MKQEKADAIMGYTIKPVIYGSLAGWLACVKNRTAMVTGAGYLFASKSVKAQIIKRISFILYRMGLGAAQKVIFQNIDDLNEFVEHKLVKKEKCYVVNGSGVNMNRYTPSAYPETPSFFSRQTGECQRRHGLCEGCQDGESRAPRGSLYDLG